MESIREIEEQIYIVVDQLEELDHLISKMIARREELTKISNSEEKINLLDRELKVLEEDRLRLIEEKRRLNDLKSYANRSNKRR